MTFTISLSVDLCIRHGFSYEYTDFGFNDKLILSQNE